MKKNAITHAQALVMYQQKYNEQAAKTITSIDCLIKALVDMKSGITNSIDNEYGFRAWLEKMAIDYNEITAIFDDEWKDCTDKYCTSHDDLSKLIVRFAAIQAAHAFVEDALKQESSIINNHYKNCQEIRVKFLEDITATDQASNILNIIKSIFGK